MSQALKFIGITKALKKLKTEVDATGSREILPTGFSYTSTNQPQLHFSLGGKKYVVIQQNPATGSRGAQLAQAGHFVGVIRDLTPGLVGLTALVGYADADTEMFEPFNIRTGISADAVDADALLEAEPELMPKKHAAPIAGVGPKPPQVADEESVSVISDPAAKRLWDRLSSAA